MEIKIDTKEKFTVLTPIVPHLSANMADELINKCQPILNGNVKNIVLNLQSVSSIDEEMAHSLAQLQQNVYEDNNSFVICCLKDTVEAVFEKTDLLEYLNVTPTESEAWDIIQMEEIERELMDGF